MSSPRFESKIKFFDSRKRFGFILPTGPMVSDIFLPEEAMLNNYRPQQGDLVSFSVKKSRRGLIAVDVNLVRQKDKLTRDSVTYLEEL